MTWWSVLWSRFWALPLTVAAASLGLGLLLPAVDAAADQPPGWVFQGGVDGARSVLSTIAGAMISVTGLVFSITMVVLQLASSQFSPRILRSFLDSRIVQLTLGVFTGSFLYALAVLRAVRGDDGWVPEIAVTASSLYVVMAVAMFLAFIHHITMTVQVTHVMARVRRRAITTAQRLTSDDDPERSWSPNPRSVSAPICNADHSGYVTSLDSARLVAVARRVGGVVELEITPGDHLAPEQRIGRLWGVEELSHEDQHDLQASVSLSSERDIGGDAAFGVRQLLDIAERALSPGINDPTTAVQAVNELHVVLQALAQRPDPSPYLRHEGAVVAVYKPQRYADTLRGAVAELAYHGRSSDRLLNRLCAVLQELADVARPEHQAATRALIPRLDADCARSAQSEGESPTGI